MQLSLRILTALAVLMLFVAVLVFRVGDSGDGVDAATGTIDVLNVGTCYTTDDSVFSVGDCKDGDGGAYSVAGRTAITESEMVYATYALDPKTSGYTPRGILKYADHIMVSIEDKGRDTRVHRLFGVGTTSISDGDLAIIQGDISDVTLTAGSSFVADRMILNSGAYEFRLDGGDANDHPMAPRGDGKVYWYGKRGVSGASDCDTGTASFGNINESSDGGGIELDEDLSTGEGEALAPWMRVIASVPEGQCFEVEYIYYQTSPKDVIDGNDVDIVLNAGSDGDVPTRNLVLKETGFFTGRFEGYLMLTDANGDGREYDPRKYDPNEFAPADAAPNDWGMAIEHATDGTMDGAAVLGVESGPVTITYKNSVDDTKTMSIGIDTVPPSISIASPANGTVSKDDSPDIYGTFADDMGLREGSFGVYVDNNNDGADDDPIWDLGVNDDTNTAHGYVVPVDGPNGTVALRGEYDGFRVMETFGVIPSSDVYIDTSDRDGTPSSANPGDGDNADDYKIAAAEDFEDGDLTGEFDDVVRIDFLPDDFGGYYNDRYNNTIDYQGVVLDVAGNFGFSDSDPSGPTFIHDYGTAKSRNGGRNESNYNVLGVYSRHVYRLDDVRPYFKPAESATGFFTDENGDVMASNSGLKVMFDNDVAADSIGVETFAVQLDDGTNATIMDVDVDGSAVYIMLEETLDPDATPKIRVAEGEAVVDLAGNEATWRRITNDAFVEVRDGFDLNDGILPTFTITLSNGTGLNAETAGESSSELTKNRMTIHISADEEIAGAPEFSVVCSGLAWGDDGDKEFGDLAGELSGNRSSTPMVPKKMTDDDGNVTSAAPMCGGSEFVIPVTSALSRSGENWEYVWSNLSGESNLSDGNLSVVVWGRDRNSFKSGGVDMRNWSSSTASFVLDRDLMAAWEDGSGSELVPAPSEVVFEERPFVLLDFGDEGTTVDVSKFTVDGVDFTSDLQALDGNEFVWWPEPLAIGSYDVYVEANDAANNSDEHSYSFSVQPRQPFVLDLLAGWNAVSLPANPVDRALHAVFTEAEVDQVISWDVTDPVSPWRMATRVDGVWTTSDMYATLNDVEARYGYWVHATGFVRQPVPLSGKGDRSTDGQPSPADIPTDEGWNFVGVVDVDGDQTQNDAGSTLQNDQNEPITAGEYLGKYTRAYTWSHVDNTWELLRSDEGLEIGTGIWVFYTNGTDIAP